MQKIEVGQVWSHHRDGLAVIYKLDRRGGSCMFRFLEGQPRITYEYVSLEDRAVSGWTLAEPAVTVQPNMVFALRSDPESRWVVLEADQQPHGVTRVRNVSTGIVARVKNKDWGFTRAFKDTGTVAVPNLMPATGEKDPSNLSVTGRRFVGSVPEHGAPYNWGTVRVKVCPIDKCLPILAHEMFYGGKYDFDLRGIAWRGGTKRNNVGLQSNFSIDETATICAPRMQPSTAYLVDKFFKDLKREGFPITAATPSIKITCGNASEFRILLEAIQSCPYVPVQVSGHTLRRGDRLLQALLEVSVAEFNRRMGGV